MCACCTDYVRRLLRIVRATEARRFRSWQAETWFKRVVDASNGLGTMPEADYNALNALQTYFKEAITSGLRVWQSHSLASPTERGEPQSPPGSVLPRGNSPSPTGALLPAPPQPISPELPMPKAVSMGASAEQGERFLLEAQVRSLRWRQDQRNGVKFQLVKERRKMED